MRILIHGINFSPELTGIGKYSGEMAEWLAAQGHEVRVVTAPPYYPQWRIADGFSNWWYRDEMQVTRCKVQGEGANVPAFSALTLLESIAVYRCPLWVPTTPSGLKRVIHLASFALSSLPVMLRQALWKPDVVFVVEPSLMSAPSALLVSLFGGGKSWLHVQDLEVDAAFELGILKSKSLRRLVLAIECWLMRRFDRVSTISPKMLEKLSDKFGRYDGMSRDVGSRDDVAAQFSKMRLFPNWVDIESIRPLGAVSPFRAELGVGAHDVVALYSGNMGEKQGLEAVLEAARKLEGRSGIRFVLCGDGAAKARLSSQYSGLSNVIWLPLQPLERLNELLNLADIHLLPQRADAADLVMPSKLTGMLASGKPVVATAYPGTQVAKVVMLCGRVVRPGDVDGLVQALSGLADDDEARNRLGHAGRIHAEENMGRDAILSKFEDELLECVG